MTMLPSVTWPSPPMATWSPSRGLAAHADDGGSVKLFHRRHMGWRERNASRARPRRPAPRGGDLSSVAQRVDVGVVGDADHPKNAATSRCASTNCTRWPRAVARHDPVQQGAGGGEIQPHQRGAGHGRARGASAQFGVEPLPGRRATRRPVRPPARPDRGVARRRRPRRSGAIATAASAGAGVEPSRAPSPARVAPPGLPTAAATPRR